MYVSLLKMIYFLYFIFYAFLIIGGNNSRCVWEEYFDDQLQKIFRLKDPLLLIFFPRSNFLEKMLHLNIVLTS